LKSLNTGQDAVPERSLVALANRLVPFPQAARWAGVRYTGDERRNKVRCPVCEDPDDWMRIYPAHGWCFAEHKLYTPVSLLAGVWELSKDDAAARALERIGYVPPDLDSIWEHACREPEPDREALAAALAVFCSRFPDWKTRQYEPAVSAVFARCLGLLPLVKTEADCAMWFQAVQHVMQTFLGQSQVSRYTSVNESATASGA
jgi:hypothetical protein